MSRDLENLRQIDKRTKELNREIVKLRIKWNEDKKRTRESTTHKFQFVNFFNICWK